MFIIKEEDSHCPGVVKYRGSDTKHKKYYGELEHNINAVSPYGHTDKSLNDIKHFIRVMRKTGESGVHESNKYKIFTLLVVNGKNQIQKEYPIDDIMDIYDAESLR